jgi:hypothetical protein
LPAISGSIKKQETATDPPSRVGMRPDARYSDARAKKQKAEIWRALTQTQQDKVQGAPALER